MDEIGQLLQQREKLLKKAVNYAKHIINKAPDGILRVSYSHHSEQYYFRTSIKDTYGKYIRKKEKKLLHDLAQKDYAIKLLASSQIQLSILQDFTAKYEDNAIFSIYEELPEARQKLVKPYMLPEKEFVLLWEQPPKPIIEDARAGSYFNKSMVANLEDGIYTEKGEAVRSKSEKILADRFTTIKIPYHYEKPLYLNGYGYIHPDFTVLNRRTRKEYYWEHMGLMDNEEYCEKAIKKIESMEKNNLFSGESVILTYETKNHPLNIKVVNELIQKYLL